MTRVTRRSIALAIPLIALGPAPRAIATSGTPTWSFSQVNDAEAGAYFSSPVLAFDHYGTPSVAWSSVSTIGGSNSVRHSQLTGLGLWSTRQLDSGATVGVRTALAFDRAERPTLAWVHGGSQVQGQFNYGSNLPIAASGASGSSPIVSLRYDLAGNLRGMYAGATPGTFFSIGYSGGSFSSAAMTTLSGVTNVIDAAMTTDGRGLRQLAARTVLSGGQQAVSLASEPAGGGNWALGTLAQASSVDGVDVAMDPTDGRLAVAYTTFDSGTSTSKLIYTKFNGAIPQTTEVLSSTTTRYFDVSLAFDLSDGRPGIAYERFINAGSLQQLAYSYLDASSAWQTSLVDGTIQHAAPGNAVRRPSLAFDDYGTSWPAIAYVDSDGSLDVAFDPPAPEPAAGILLLVSLAVLRPRPRER